MRVKIIILIALSLILVSGAYAQKLQRGVIYLKNGSEIRGKLIPSDWDKTILRSGRNIWVFDNSEISDKPIFSQVSKSFEPSGNWFLKTSAGMLIGSSNNTKSAPFTFDASFNYKVYQKMYAGVGVGVDYLDESYMPVFLNIEYQFRETRLSPFVGFQGGYMFALDGDVTRYNYPYYAYDSYYPYYYPEELSNKGGIMLNPSFGFINRINENFALSLSFGYRYSRATFKGENDYGLETNYNRLSIRLGVLFN